MNSSPARPGTPVDVTAPMDWAEVLPKRIQIAVITYNRAAKVDATLAQLARSPFRNCRIYVLDNCSTDGTSEICQTWAARFSDLRPIRHRINIGACANYLRAVELCTADYSWILCDDDSFDFTKAGDICERIAAGDTDLISVGVETHALEPGWRGSAYDCAMGQDYFLSHSFTPSLIYRTSLFDSKNVIRAYDDCETLFPQLAFAADAALSRRSLYISREKVIRKSNHVGYPPLGFTAGWLRCCGRFPNRQLRNRALAAVFGGLRLPINFAFGVMLARSCGHRGILRKHLEILLESCRFSVLIFLKLAAMFPLVVLLVVAHPFSWNLFLLYRNRQKGMAAPEYDGDR